LDISLGKGKAYYGLAPSWRFFFPSRVGYLFQVERMMTHKKRFDFDIFEILDRTISFHSGGRYLSSFKRISKKGKN